MKKVFVFTEKKNREEEEKHWIHLFLFVCFFFVFHSNLLSSCFVSNLYFRSVLTNKKRRGKNNLLGGGKREIFLLRKEGKRTDYVDIMAEMDVLQSKIIQQIEIYLSETNLRNDYHLSKYERFNNGWIPLEHLNQFNKLSTYKYETVLNALQSKKSNLIEIEFSPPVSIRRRRQPLKEQTMTDNPYLYQTVVVNGLPRDAKHNELVEFFNRFYPILNIKMLTSPRTNQTFSGKVHVIFRNTQDAQAFVQKSELQTLIYVNEYVLQLCNGYTLVCRMLADCDDKDENDIIKQTDQIKFRNGHSFSHRLTNHSPRVSFNPKVSQTKLESSYPPLIRSKSCLKSSTCATEQILFCQNTIDRKSTKILEYQTQSIVKKSYSYKSHISSEQLVKQTYECMIIAALNPHCFTVQLKENAIEFDRFQRDINEFYNEFINENRYRIPIEIIEKYLCVICADPNSSDKDPIWNRSQILDYDPVDRTVNLFYIDLGTWEEYVPINRLRYLIEYFHEYPVYSLTCRLAHIAPINTNENDLTWSPDAIEQFLAVIDQVLPEIEFLSLANDGCYQTNLFVVNSGQYICVNDYMIHIKKAQPIIQNRQIDGDFKNSNIHPVIALYYRLGETLKRSLSQKFLVKLIHIEQKYPLIFIHYNQQIYIPDFNIYTLLQIVNSTIDIQTIEDYALTIKYQSIGLTRSSHSEIFHQLDSCLKSTQTNRKQIHLYTIDFVRYILERHYFPVANVFIELDKAKFALIYEQDLSNWFANDNKLSQIELNSLNKPDNQQFSTKRLPFSNRLIGPI